MINFNKGEELPNKFHGSEKKITILYEKEVYMIKFPDPIRKKNNPLSYMNNQFSEHIGCSIFKSCDFNTQETVLGYYKDKKGKVKIVVGCKDFTQDGSILYEFTKLSNAVIEIDEALGTTIENVNLVINHSDWIINKSDIFNRFWDMFVVDALIANADRHFDNWGLLEKEGKFNFAPIYDCGSTLDALLDDSIMKRLLSSPADFKNEEFNVTSCYFIKGKRIFYHEIIKNPPKELANAIKRIVPKIDINKIHNIIDSVLEISDVRKEYLKRAIDLRYETILFPALKKVLK